MKPASLNWPLGLQFAPHERPQAQRLLQPGYTFRELEDAHSAYRFIIQADMQQLLPLFYELLRILPQETFFILEYYSLQELAPESDNNEPHIYYSPLLETQELLECLECFLPRLMHEGLLGFGLANNRFGTEIFLSEEKVFTCFTSNPVKVCHLLNQQGLAYRQQLYLPTDFHHQHLPLSHYGRGELPPELQQHSTKELDYRQFCPELIEFLEMFPVEEDCSFFFSQKEQDEIAQILTTDDALSHLAEEDFAYLLLDWIDFCHEVAHHTFEGTLSDYRDALQLRDAIDMVQQGVRSKLADKISYILQEADSLFRACLIDCSKSLAHRPQTTPHSQRFWHWGIISNQGTNLRRDLIRQGWYQS